MWKTVFLLILVCISACNNEKSAPAISKQNNDTIRLVENYHNGEKLFNEHCRSCHHPPDTKAKCVIRMDKTILESFPSPSYAYFLNYVRDTRSLRDSGDVYAIAKGKEYSSVYSHDFKDRLSDQEIILIHNYIIACGALRDSGKTLDK